MSLETSRVAVAVVILTLNEEKQIVGAIESVAGWASEVIVVDSGSTDQTVARARSCGATVLVNRPAPPFLISEQRNWALDSISSHSEWVVFLDADERATTPFLDAVAGAVMHSELDGFYAAPKFMYQGTWLRHFMGYPNWHARVINRKRCRLIGGVWEDFPKSAVVGHIAEPYLHFANLNGLDDWMTKHVRYARWEGRGRDGAGPERRETLRKWARRLGALRPLVALIYYLLIRRGYRDGGSVWSYARRQFIYELLILEARRETTRDLAGLPR